MFWPTVTPFMISIIATIIIVATLTIFAPSLKWKRKNTFSTSAIIGFIMIIPSCTGIMFIMAPFRFGIFTYQKYEEVKDFRIERYLPKESINITLDKSAGGYRARYQISEQDLLNYIDDLWDKYEHKSAIKRKDFSGDKSIMKKEYYEYMFKGLKWELPETTIKYHIPVASNGAGATYFYNPNTNIVYQRASYW
jgi:hypothetical protein